MGIIYFSGLHRQVDIIMYCFNHTLINRVILPSSQGASQSSSQATAGLSIICRGNKVPHGLNLFLQLQDLPSVQLGTIKQQRLGQPTVFVTSSFLAFWAALFKACKGNSSSFPVRTYMSTLSSNMNCTSTHACMHACTCMYIHPMHVHTSHWCRNSGAAHVACRFYMTPYTYIHTYIQEDYNRELHT